MTKDEKALLAKLDAVRNFPTNTCPASRHAQMIGEFLLRKEPYAMLYEEPEHCGVSVLSVVASLYEARTEIERLRRLAGES